jgi:hypothetical protein
MKATTRQLMAKEVNFNDLDNNQILNEFRSLNEAFELEFSIFKPITKDYELFKWVYITMTNFQTKILNDLEEGTQIIFNLVIVLEIDSKLVKKQIYPIKDFINDCRKEEFESLKFGIVSTSCVVFKDYLGETYAFEDIKKIILNYILKSKDENLLEDNE